MPESVRDFRVKLRLATARLDSLSGEEQPEATSNLQQNNRRLHARSVPFGAVASELNQTELAVPQATGKGEGGATYFLFFLGSNLKV